MTDTSAAAAAAPANTTEASRFPLYDALVRHVESNRPQYDWSTLARQALSLSNDQMEIAVAVVLMYASLEKGTRGSAAASSSKQTVALPSRLPFKSKSFDRGLGFCVEIDNLPSRLQDMLALFIIACSNANASAQSSAKA
jgi:hypothetical protein